MKDKARKILKSMAIFFSLFLLITGCSNSDNTIENEPDENQEEEVMDSFTARVNDEGFTGTNSTLGDYVSAAVSFVNNRYLFTISAVEIQLNSPKANYIGLYITGYDFDEIIAGAKFNIPANLFVEPLFGDLEGAFAEYSADIDNDDYVDGLLPETLEEITIEITAIDRENKLISGNFSFKGTNEEGTITYNITDGLFTNVAYENQ